MEVEYTKKLTRDNIKKGDRIICSEKIGHDSESGLHGRVVETARLSDTVGVEFDKNIGGHNSDGLGKQGHCWYMHISGLRLE